MTAVNVSLPQYATPGSAGLDLRANESADIPPHGRALIPTGLAIAIPDGYAGFVQPRSGMALKRGLSIANTPGLIDAHYRGELKVIAVNLDPRGPRSISSRSTSSTRPIGAQAASARAARPDPEHPVSPRST